MRNVGLPELLVLFVFVPLLLLPTFFYLITLQKALERCSTESRTLSPGMVWLLLIPLFNLVWNFIVVTNLSRSLRNEFTRRNFPGIEPEPGKGIGLAMSILSACCVIPFLGVLAGLAAFICWILYWVKINDYSKKLSVPLEPIPAGGWSQPWH